MPIETLSFFYVALSGFMAVSTFRHFTNTKEKPSEFEWLGFSVFWGLAILTLWDSLPDDPTRTKLFQNPLGSGFVLSLMGIILGCIVGLLWKWISKDR